MSRLAKNSIAIPSNVTVSVAAGTMSVRGPLGELSRTVHPSVSVVVGDDGVRVTPLASSKLSRALSGTFAAHLRNMLRGVTAKYEKKLELQGIGYKVELQGRNLKFQVGFSHPVVIAIPTGIDALVEKNNITISGIDKEAVGQFAANVRAIKKPEPYKGKGIRYAGEYVREKQGKKAAA